MWQIPDTTTVEERLRILTDLAMQGTSSEAVQKIAQSARSLTAKTIFPNPRWGLAAYALSLVQATGYHPDPPGEWFQNVSYTATNGGDCEDLATLLMSVLYLLGFESRLVWLDQPGKQYNHVSLQVRISDQWVWAETSIEGSWLGEHPYAAAGRLDASHKLAGASERAAA